MHWCCSYCSSTSIDHAAKKGSYGRRCGHLGVRASCRRVEKRRSQILSSKVSKAPGHPTSRYALPSVLRLLSSDARWALASLAPPRASSTDCTQHPPAAAKRRRRSTLDAGFDWIVTHLGARPHIRRVPRRSLQRVGGKVSIQSPRVNNSLPAPAPMVQLPLRVKSSLLDTCDRECSFL